VTWLAGGGGYSFTISNVKNPFSVQTSDGFSNIILQTKSPNFDIAAFNGADPAKPGKTAGITNSKAAPL
jgi:hypothetical protein